ncbi:hypothetical protein L3Y34_002306 [Caenorhabditis briggsae]|uniref:Sdz-33 F-box domain-containing protein n=2 Tax=Caenorhabditis briggsae TaxID=6238 RepID=A0AAE9ISF9_CAEBR|nr:hypothetical protein L3Y34_002306 [Caenorhabditis briggsae]
MRTDPLIELDFGDICIVLEFEMGKNYDQMTSLNDVPVSLNVFKEDIRINLAVTMSNQGMALREWIQHLCSISNKVKLYEADFRVGDMELDIQSLRNAFPKLRKIDIYGSQNENFEHEILNAQFILRAFLPYVKEVQLFHVPLGENLSFQHIGMANLKNLDFVHPKNLNFDCLLTLNVQMCMLQTDQMPLRDLNHFFKLWIKGSNPRLKALSVWCDTETVPDWNVLLKGLRTKGLEKVEEEEGGEIEDEDEQEDDEVEDEDEVDEEEQSEEESHVESEESESERSESEEESGEELDEEEMEGGEGKKFFIMNCHGMSGQIEVKHFEGSASVTFFVSKINWSDKASHWT